MWFVGNYAHSGLSPQTDGVPVIQIKAAYEKAAAGNNALLVFAGDAFDKAYKAGKPVFDPDGSHPSPLGSRIIAEEFSKAL